MDYTYHKLELFVENEQFTNLVAMVEGNSQLLGKDLMPYYSQFRNQILRITQCEN